MILDLPLCESHRRDDFYVSPSNALALAAIDGWRAWPGLKSVLTGPEGSGKTHLAQIWADAASGTRIPAMALSTADLPALAATGGVAVEDAERIAGNPAREEALFHLHNLLAERGLPLLVTAATPPRDWGIALPDLASRLQAASVIRLLPPDDTLLRAVMAKMFADRQVIVAPAILEWAALRMTRSLSAARALVQTLDARALAEGGPITRQMAEDWLDGDTLFPLD